MIEAGFAEQFASEWIDAWNNRDPDRILRWYDEQVTAESPLIARLSEGCGGRLTGREQVREHWERVLRESPRIRFELISVLTGVETITLYYYSKGVQGRVAAEVLRFGPERTVVQSLSHFTAS